MIFGLGSQYSARYDKFPEFKKKRCACLGWSRAKAPPLHAILKHFRTGEIVFIKSFTPNMVLTIKAVGVVTEGRCGPTRSSRLAFPCGGVGRDRNGSARSRIRLDVKVDEHRSVIASAQSFIATDFNRRYRDAETKWNSLRYG